MKLGLGLYIGSAPLVTPQPTITVLNYAQGDTAGGGQDIVITGTNLTGATAVTFLGTAATSYTVDSDTQITATLPAHAAGSGDVEVTTSGGGATSAFEYWSPAELTLSGWWRGSFAGAPWSPTASAGGSGTVGNFTNTWSTPPATGAAVGGFTPADFDGSNDKLRGPTCSSLWTTSAGTCLALFKADTAAGDDIYNVPSLLNYEGNGYVIFGYTNLGLRSAIFNGGYKTPAPVACTTGTWHLGMMRWNGTTVEHSVDGGIPTSAAAGGPSSLSSSSTMGIGNGSACFDGQIMEMITMQSVISDGNISKVRLYAKQRYGVTL